jgi:hypothetical protein
MNPLPPITARAMKIGRCRLTTFERRLYCFKKRTSPYCLKPKILGYRCPNLEWTKEEIMVEVKGGAKEISSPGGFSDEAVKYAERFRPGLRLRQGSKIIKTRAHNVKKLKYKKHTRKLRARS